MNKNIKGNTMLIVLAGVLAILVIGYVVWFKKGQMATVSTMNQYGQIQTNSDLKKATSDLDSSDIGALDTQLNQLSSDSSGF